MPGRLAELSLINLFFNSPMRVSASKTRLQYGQAITGGPMSAVFSPESVAAFLMVAALVAGGFVELP
jgi:hypothetical protein